MFHIVASLLNCATLHIELRPNISFHTFVDCFNLFFQHILNHFSFLPKFAVQSFSFIKFVEFNIAGGNIFNNVLGLSATMFQFSPLVEHFLQSITKSQQTNANLPLLVLDPNAKASSAADTSDLFKVMLLLHNFSGGSLKLWIQRK